MENCSVCSDETKFCCGAGHVGSIPFKESTLSLDRLGNRICNIPICRKCGSIPSIFLRFAMLGNSGWFFCPTHAKAIMDNFTDELQTSLKSHPDIANKICEKLKNE